MIVTGAGRGLGRAHALELTRHGATVVLNDRNVSLRGEADTSAANPPVEEVANQIREMGGTAFVNGDSVTDWSAMEALVRETVDQFGDLHGVVNNAGFIRDRMITSMTEDDFDAVVGVHLKGTFNVTRHACAFWRERGKGGAPVSGRIVNTTSGAGLWGNIGQANYASAKAAIAALTVVTALEMERYCVTANCISPIAATRMLASAGVSGAGGAWDRLDPENASPVVAWLCSESSSWLSGQILRVDGNRLVRVNGYEAGVSHEAKSHERLTAEEIGLAARQMFGCVPRGLSLG